MYRHMEGEQQEQQLRFQRLPAAPPPPAALPAPPPAAPADQLPMHEALARLQVRPASAAWPLRV